MSNAEFILIPKDIAIRLDITSTAKILYGLLNFRQGDNTDSFWSVSSLAKDLGFKATSAIEKATTQLEDRGLLKVKRGRKKTKGSEGIPNRYTIKHLPEKMILDNDHLPQRTTSSSTEDDDHLPQRIDKEHTKVTTKVTGKTSVSSPQKPKASAEEKPTPREFLDYYNSKAEGTKAAKATKLSQDRIRKITTRLKDPDFTKGWRDIIDRAFRSPFLMSEVPPTEGHKLFQLDIDFIIKNDTHWVRIAEGFYDDRSGSGSWNSKSSDNNSEPVEYSEEWWAKQEHIGQAFDKQHKLGEFAEVSQ